MVVCAILFTKETERKREKIITFLLSQCLCGKKQTNARMKKPTEQHMTLFLPEIANGEDLSSPFVNCLRNTYRHVRKWAKRTHTNAFRIYDRELYHYPLAIDFYAGRYSIHYFQKDRDVEEIPEEVVSEVEASLKLLFGTEPHDIYWRSRIRRKKYEQYEKRSDEKEFFSVLEYGTSFLVNLTDYLDTGLFLDHRETRRCVALQAKDKRLLNLFSYTASFSVQAAMQGAKYTKSVDLSNTYSDWAVENFRLNNLSLKNNVILRADCLTFLDEERRSAALYDIIVIDPPTISRSKKMQGMFDVQQDYHILLIKALDMLAPGGTIFFSTNLRTFVFDKELFSSIQVRDISNKCRPIDFKDPKIHQVYQLKK